MARIAGTSDLPSDLASGPPPASAKPSRPQYPCPSALGGGRIPFLLQEFPMTKRPWVRNVFARSRPIRKPPHRVRLGVELLESRNVLSGFLHLDPRGPANLPETVPVNFVFVGYTP